MRLLEFGAQEWHVTLLHKVPIPRPVTQILAAEMFVNMDMCASKQASKVSQRLNVQSKASPCTGNVEI